MPSSETSTLAIATNPLFPLTAIEQRLDWAGLSPEEYPFSIVPSYENAHFAKPNPAFLAELLARLGWPEGPVVMVGDDPDNDVRCGLELGLARFLVEGSTRRDEPRRWGCRSWQLGRSSRLDRCATRRNT